MCVINVLNLNLILIQTGQENFIKEKLLGGLIKTILFPIKDVVNVKTKDH
jgi:hypothetical protein